jgi:membrane fusion protein (multidrug efflux system)
VTEGRAALEASLVAVRSSEAAVAEAEARLEARRAAAAAVRAELDAALTAHRKAGRDLERMRALMRDDFVSRREHDDAEAALETAAANLEAARRRLVQAERETEQVVAELRARGLAVDEAHQKVAEARGSLARVEGEQHQVAVKTADVSRAEARLREAQADLAVAELAVAHTEVRAPLDGIVAKRSVEVGQIVQMGQPLLAIVPLHEVWVVANFKETQLTRLRPGMKAEIEIDSYPGQTFTGTVQSLSAGTGSRFSLLPPENATGNWVKVVQRVPVKILLDGTRATNPHPLRAGMSAVVTIRVR